MGACNVFDGMPTSEFDDWRPPNRCLEVTIHKVCYPVTESLLHQVFCPFGEVEEVYVCKHLEHVKARVVFQSKLEAAEAFGELHGRNIYDGCCQMEIKWGVSQEPNVSVAMSNGDTATSLFHSTTVARSTLDKLDSEKLSMEADAFGAHTEDTVLAATVCSSTISIPLITISDVMDHNVDDELPVLAVSTIAKEVTFDTSIAIAAAPGIGTTTSNVTIDVLNKCSAECSATDINVLTSASDADATPTLPLISPLLISNNWSHVDVNLASLVQAKLGIHHVLVEMLLNFDGFQNYFANLEILRDVSTRPCVQITAFNCIHQREDENMLVLWICPVQPVGQQPWPPPLLLKMLSIDGPAKRPTPWPSFWMCDDGPMLCFFCLVAVGYIPETDRMHIQFIEGVMVIFIDQGCMAEIDLFATLEGKESLQCCCLYGELCLLIIHPWLRPFGECELLGISLWFRIFTLRGRLLEQLVMLSKRLFDLRPWRPPQIHSKMLHLFIQGMQFVLWYILLSQGDQKLLHLISELSEISSCCPIPYKKYTLYICCKKLLQAPSVIWCYMLNFHCEGGAILYQKQKKYGEMLLPWHIHAQVLSRFLLVEWGLKSMIARHTVSSFENRHPLLDEQSCVTSRFLSKCSQLEETHRVLSPFRSAIELFSLDQDDHETELPWHCNLLSSVYLRWGRLFYFKMYSSAIKKFSKAQFSALIVLVCKFSWQELAAHTGRHILPGQILEVITGGQFVGLVSGNSLVVLIADSSETLQVSVGKESVGPVCKKSLERIHSKISWLNAATVGGTMASILLMLVIKDLHVPWDPGGTVILMEVSLSWLEGKPKLKEGGMLGSNSILEWNAEWAVTWQQDKAQAEHREHYKGVSMVTVEGHEMNYTEDNIVPLLSQVSPLLDSSSTILPLDYLISRM
ncbi:unnamed protein product [Urochloa humidicola]